MSYSFQGEGSPEKGQIYPEDLLKLRTPIDLSRWENIAKYENLIDSTMDNGDWWSDPEILDALSKTMENYLANQEHYGNRLVGFLLREGVLFPEETKKRLADLCLEALKADLPMEDNNVLSPWDVMRVIEGFGLPFDYLEAKQVFEKQLDNFDASEKWLGNVELINKIEFIQRWNGKLNIDLSRYAKKLDIDDVKQMLQTVWDSMGLYGVIESGYFNQVLDFSRKNKIIAPANENEIRDFVVELTKNEPEFGVYFEPGTLERYVKEKLGFNFNDLEIPIKEE